MGIGLYWITGVKVGFELMENEVQHLLAVDLLILRIVFVFMKRG